MIHMPLADRIAAEMRSIHVFLTAVAAAMPLIADAIEGAAVEKDLDQIQTALNRGLGDVAVMRKFASVADQMAGSPVLQSLIANAAEIARERKGAA